MITEQEYQQAQALVRQYKQQQNSSLLVEQQQKLAQERRSILLAAIEDPSVDGIDIGDDHWYRIPHKIVWINGSDQRTFPDNDWYAFRASGKRLFPHQEDWIESESIIDGAEGKRGSE